MPLSHRIQLPVRRLLIGLLLLAAWAATPVGAQVEIHIELRNNLYIQYGQIPATITIRNLAGRDVFLDNEPGKPWLSFRLQHESGRMATAIDPLLRFPPLLIRSGETLRRTVDLNRIFSMETLGQYALLADLYLLGPDTYVTSNRITFNLIRGFRIWNRTVGVPDHLPGGGERRQISLYTHRLTDRVYLYLEILNPDTGEIFCMRRLGRYASYARQISVETDQDNSVHILYLAAPKTFLYVVADLNGTILESSVYQEAASRPSLVNQSGRVRVAGGSPRGAADSPTQRPAGVPAISDRPVRFD